MLFASAAAQACPRMDLSHTGREGRAGEGRGGQKSVLRSVQRENSPSGRAGWRVEVGGGGVNIQITVTGTACLL